MISPLIKWEHSEDFFVHLYKNEAEIKGGHRVVLVQQKSDDWNFVTGHMIDGKMK